MNTLSLLSNDAKYFDDSSNRLSEVRSLLDSRDVSNKLEAMKCLLAMISVGRDVSDYFADVVKNIVCEHSEVKKLVYIYLIHYSEDNNDIALLSINTFQKEMNSSVAQTRANALKAMSSIRIPIVAPLVLLALKSTVKDTSAYVRRATASAIPKVYRCDPSPQTYEECVDLIAELLNNTEPTVLGSALYAYSQICAGRVELLHKHIRKICHLLADFDEWGQIIAVDILLKYARTQFADPNASLTDDTSVEDNGSTALVLADNRSDASSELKASHNAKQSNNSSNKKTANKNKSFYSDDESDSSAFNTDSDNDTPPQRTQRKRTPVTAVVRHVQQHQQQQQQQTELQQLDEDHRLLLKQAAQLLYSPNAGVTVAVANLYLHIAPRAEFDILVKPLVRALRSKRYVQYTVLSVVSTLTSQPHMAKLFQPYITDFFVFVADPMFTREAKLDVLCNVATVQNSQLLLSELTHYLHDQSVPFVCLTIRTFNRLANKLPSIAEHTIMLLMKLVKSHTPSIVAQSVIAITQLLQLDPSTHGTTIHQIAKLLKHVQSPTARQSIVWIIGEYHAAVAEIVPDVLRVLCQSFKQEDDSVKLQILNVAVKLYISYGDDQRIVTLFRYVMEMCRYDMNYDIRDRARLLRALLFKRKQPSSATKATSETTPTTDSDIFAGTSSTKPASSPNDDSAEPADSISAQVKEQLKRCFIAPKPTPQVVPPFNGRSKYQLGTMSHLLNRRLSGYTDLPDCPDADHVPDGSARKPVTPQTLTPTTGARRGVARKHASSDDDDSDVSDTESAGVPDGEFSEFGSETESDSDTDEVADKKKPSHKSAQQAKQQRQAKHTASDDDSQFGSSDDDDTLVSSKQSALPAKKPATTNKPAASSTSAKRSPQQNGRTTAPSTAKTKPAKPSASKSTSKQINDTYDILDLTSIRDSLVDDQRTNHDAGVAHSDLMEMNTQLLDFQPVSSKSPRRSTTSPAHVSSPKSNNRADLAQALSGYKSPSTSQVCALLIPAQSGGLAVDYVFVRKPSMYGTQFSVIDLTVRNQSSQQFKAISFQASAAHNDSVRGIDQTIQVLPVSEQYTIKIHVDFHGRTEAVPLTVVANHGSFNVKLQPLMCELVVPTLITHTKFDQVRRRMGGGFSVHSSKEINVQSARAAVQAVLNACNVAALAQTDDDDAVFHFAGSKVSDDTPLLLVLQMNGETKCKLTVYMDDMLNGGHVLDTLVKAVGGAGK